MASAVASRKRAGFRQPRMGPAPFASFEQDLSDGADSPPEEERRAPLPGIQEDSPATPAAPPTTLNVVAGVQGGLQTPATPRIDISRASSSSQHEEGDSGDSRASTPEHELFAGQGGLGFKEEGAAELRSSTEELDYHEDATERERRRERLQRRKERGRGSMPQPVFKYELEAQSEKERKDSACSLPVSGRTSRLSSVGSAASGASSAASALSVASRGAVSAISAATSRSPSPHRMLLETSFCGSKPIPTQSIDLDSPCKHETESLEKVLLARQTDPTRAVIAVEFTPSSPKPVSLDLATGGTKLPQSFPGVVETHPAPPEITPHPPAPQEEAPQHREQPEPSSSPKPSRHHATLRREENEKDSKTPSPSTSRKSSFGNLFRRTESPLSPESPTTKRKNSFAAKVKEVRDDLRDRTRSRSKSSERSNSILDGKTKKDSKNKSVFSSLFKKKSKQRSGSSGSVCSSEEAQSPQGTHGGSQDGSMSPIEIRLTDTIAQVEFTFSPEPIDRRAAIRERVVSEEREAAEMLPAEEAPPELPAKSSAEELPPELPARSAEQVPPELPAKSIHVAVEDTPPPELPAKSEEVRPPEVPPKSAEKPREIQQEVVTTSPEPSATSPEVSDEAAFVPLEPPRSSEGLSSPATPSQQHLSPLRQLEAQNSSDSEMDRSREESAARAALDGAHESELEPERKTLVMQDSFEDELPYVPTTLPQERSVAIPIVPVRQRLVPAEVHPIERPRSTTPINPSNLEDFVQTAPRTGATPPPESERLRISLPREDSLSSCKPPLKSPRRLPGAKSWAEFAESGIQGESRRPSMPSPASPPPLPPRASPPQSAPQSWVNFEEIPERRKPPKKIQTLPSRGGTDTEVTYVKPEDCSCSLDAFGLSEGPVAHRCECHGSPAPPASAASVPGLEPPQQGARRRPRADQTSRSAQEAQPDRASVISESSLCEFPANPYTTEPTGGGGLRPMKPFGMDLDVHSNRSSVISQDECGSPESPPSTSGGQ